MNALSAEMNAARRRALLRLGCFCASGLTLQAMQAWSAPEREPGTEVTAALDTPLRLRFDIQLQNPGGTPLPAQSLWFCAPLSRGGTQTLQSIDSNVPFKRSDEWGAHTLLQWQTPPLPPHGMRAITLDLVVRVSPQAHAEAIEPGAWLQPERFVESDAPDIVALALTLRRDTQRDTVQAVYDWVRGELNYAGYVADDLGAAQALRSRSGDCTEYAYLVVALCRALGLPARAVGGFVVAHDAAPRSTDYHNWAEVYLAGAWRMVDAQKEALFDRPHLLGHHVVFRLLGERPLGPLGQAHRFVTDGPAQVRVR